MLGMLVQRFDFVDHLDYQLQDEDHAHRSSPTSFRIQVRPRPGVQIDRHRSPRPRPSAAVAAPRAEPAPHGRPARHAAVGAVRLEPRHRRGHRHPARAGGHRARLRRHPRRARRPRRRPAPRAAPSLVVCSSYNGTPPDNAAAFCRWISGAADGCGRRRRLHRLRLRQHRVGRDLPGRADPARRRSWRRTAAAASAPRGEGNAAGDFDAAYRAWHGGLWADLAAALDLPAEVGGRRRPPARGCRSR